MKGLSLWQPWATLWVAQSKHNETRSWATPYTGSIAVHAAKHWDRDTVKFAFTEPCRAELKDLGYNLFSLLPLGAFIGWCESVRCVSPRAALTELPTEHHFLETAFGDYSVGRSIWIPTNMHMLKTPIPYRGMQSLFDIPSDIERQILGAECVTLPVSLEK